MVDDWAEHPTIIVASGQEYRALREAFGSREAASNALGVPVTRIILREMEGVPAEPYLALQMLLLLREKPIPPGG